MLIQREGEEYLYFLKNNFLNDVVWKTQSELLRQLKRVTDYMFFNCEKSPLVNSMELSAGCSPLVQENSRCFVINVYPRVALEFYNIFGIKQKY